MKLIMKKGAAMILLSAMITHEAAAFVDLCKQSRRYIEKQNLPSNSCEGRQPKCDHYVQ
jgi:hypothetical protein